MMMRKIWLVLAGVALAGNGALGQTHKVEKPESVVRAVGVYEWTGDLGKPKASRLIPVTVFIDGELQDGGVYLARPVPFALQSGNLYELQDAGVTKGNLELAYARHLRAIETATGDSLFDDGWFGYGNFKAPVTKKASVLRASKQPVEVKTTKDDGKPHFSGKGPKDDSDSGSASSGSAGGGAAGSATPADADRPTMKRRSGSDSGSSGSDTAGKSTASSGADAGTPTDDPDRPRLSKKPSSDSSADGTVPGDVDGQSKSGSSSGSGSTAPPTTAQGGSADDPDRPTLKRRTAEEIKRDQKKEDRASVSGVGSLNNDPDRPNLHRGKPTSAMNEDDLPKLQGLPADMKQMVAVSDAANRPVHEFARPWEDDKERTAILTKMQVLARAKLAGYGAVAGPAVASPAAPVHKPATTVAARRAAAAKKKAAPAPEIALLDEELKGYTLSYGGAATYIYTAHTAGTGATLDYVTVVAQADAMGELKPAIQSVTDAAHLDRTPRMRLVDVVDAEASNRASLLFELRGERTRQFGLYSVIGAQADQRFLSGTTQ